MNEILLLRGLLHLHKTLTKKQFTQHLEFLLKNEEKEFDLYFKQLQLNLKDSRN